MPQAILVNTSAMPRRAWSVVPFGRSEVAQFGAECTFRSRDGYEHRAVRGDDRGTTSTIYRIRASFLTDDVLDGDLLDKPHAEATPRLAYHRWAVDDVKALMPNLLVQSGGLVETSALHRVQRVSTGPASERWAVVSKTPTNVFWLHWWVDFRHDDPVCSVWGIVRWSNRNDPSLDRYVDNIVLECGEYVAVANARLLGARPPLRSGDKWIVPLAEMLSFSDGSGLAFCGEMPTFKNYGSQEVDEINNEADRADLENLRAAMHGPVVGVGSGLDRSWLASGYPGNIDPLQLEVLSAAAKSRFSQLGSGTWYGNRTQGCLPSPSATGAQPDFGATKGTLGLYDPRHIVEFLWSSYAEAHRGLLHLEADGRELRADEHPNWVTWSGRTHSTGSDTLGKRRAGWSDGRSTGWTPHDDEHLSLNMLAACAALSDDPAIDALIAHQVEASLASSRHKTGNPDAARAQGRCTQAFAMLASVTADPTTLAKLHALEARRCDIAQRSLDLNSPDPGAHMRCIATILDPRKPIRDELGNLLPVVSLWEHGLALVGFCVADRRRRRTGEPRLLSDVFLRDLSRLMLRYGVTSDGALVADAAWFGGMAHPVPYTSSSRYVILAGGSGVGRWTLAGMVAAVAILAERPLGDDARLIDSARQLFPNYGLADLTEAEWFATVADVRTVGTR